jgi:outer membrane protein, heavy metal efflux system
VSLRLKLTCLVVGALPAAACVPQDAGYAEVRRITSDRTHHDVRWYEHDSQAKAASHTRSLLARPLDASAAVKLALLNNQGLQGAFEELGIARARLVEAQRLPNPTVDASLRFKPDSRPDIEVAGMLDLSELLFLAWRNGAADSGLQAAKVSVAGSVLDLAYAVRVAFYEYQAAAQLLELRRTALEALRASFEVSQKLHAAGNITDLAFASERALYEESRVQHAGAEGALLAKRDELSALMGLWGRSAEWSSEPRLEDPEPVEKTLADIEKRALERSLDLAQIRHRFEAAAKSANLASARGLLPELKAGVSAERDDEGWGVGPAAAIEVPLFYQGQGERAASLAEARRQRKLYTETAVRIRAAARATAARLHVATESAKYYKDVLLPLRAQIVDGTQLEYNAMHVGVFQLLQAKREQIETARAYVELLREYWTLRASADQLIAGRLPRAGSSPGPNETGHTAAAEAGQSAGNH